MRCGIAGMAALGFHHRDPTEKMFALGNARDVPDHAFHEEAAKCDMLCANCHLMLHAGQLHPEQALSTNIGR